MIHCVVWEVTLTRPDTSALHKRLALEFQSALGNALIAMHEILGTGKKGSSSGTVSSHTNIVIHEPNG